MRLIIAYVRPEKQLEVKAALARAEVYRYVISPTMGVGDEPVIHEHYRGADVEVDLHKKVRFEIAVNLPFVDAAINAITEAAKTGADGDGHIFVLPIERAVRIRSGQTGGEAIA